MLEITTKIPEVVLSVAKSSKSPKSLVGHFHILLNGDKVNLYYVTLIKQVLSNLSTPTTTQITIVVDGSGSMEGSKIETTKQVFDKTVQSLFKIYGQSVYMNVLCICGIYFLGCDIW